MVNASVGEAARRVTGIAIVAAVVAALGVYQATSLVLGPRADRQITVSLSVPSGSDELQLPAIPVAQALHLGQAAVARVESRLPSRPSRPAAASVRLPVHRTPAGAPVPVPAAIVPPSGGHPEGESGPGAEQSTGSRQDVQTGT
jgi:hypothetical protein